MRGICPFAIPKLIEPGSNDPPINPRAAILHVDAGGAATLFSFFKFRSGGIESHFHIRWTGKIEQYRNIFWQADANHLANGFAVSIETQGFGGGKWTRRQLRSIKRLLLWIHAETGGDVQLVKIEHWAGSGVGYHIQFGSPGMWTPVAKSCPGPERVKQYHGVIVPWLESNPATPTPDTEDDMPAPKDWDAEDWEAFEQHVARARVTAPWNTEQKVTLERALRGVWQQAHRDQGADDSPRA